MRWYEYVHEHYIHVRISTYRPNTAAQRLFLFVDQSTEYVGDDRVIFEVGLASGKGRALQHHCQHAVQRAGGVRSFAAVIPAMFRTCISPFTTGCEILRHSTGSRVMVAELTFFLRRTDILPKELRDSSC